MVSADAFESVSSNSADTTLAVYTQHTQYAQTHNKLNIFTCSFTSSGYTRIQRSPDPVKP